MKRTFDFGKVDFYKRGRKCNAVTVTMEYTDPDENGRRRFSCSGMIWNHIRSDCVAGGQCLDTIADYIKTPLFREILRLWNLYHLNDMHPECKHQAGDGWRELAGELVPVYHFHLTGEALTAQRAAKRRILTAAGTGDTVEASPEEKQILPLAFSIESAAEQLPEEIARFYKPDKVEQVRRGWLSYDKDQRGILGKPCPVCGYKYGHGWQYFQIPAADEAIILRLLEKGEI